MSDPLFNKLPGQDNIERIILRRIHENRVDGYTLGMAHEIARAAIEALREPTPEMVQVGVDDILSGPGISAYATWPDLVADRYRRMISAALSQDTLHSSSSAEPPRGPTLKAGGDDAPPPSSPSAAQFSE